MFEIIREELSKFPKKLSYTNPPSPTEVKSSKDSFIFYLLDVVPSNIGQPGLLYLFGKAYNQINDCYVSCCVTIKYCHRRYYFLPRQYFNDNPEREVTFKDVFDEVCEDVIPKLETDHVEFKKVRKKYTFEGNLPEEAEYLEIKCNVGNYRFKDRPGNTYSRILGTQHFSFVDTFLLERNIKGPSWLKVNNFLQTSPHTNCIIDIECHRIEDIVPLEIDSTPPIILMGFDFKLIKNEIVSINCIVEIHSELQNRNEVSYIDYFCIFSNGYSKYATEVIKGLDDYPHTTIFICNREHHLLLTLIEKISECDPDIIYGHNLLSEY